MKVKIFLIAFILMFNSISFGEGIIEPEDIQNVYLKTGLSFTHLIVNKYKYYSYYDSDYSSTIVEIYPVDKDTFKLVYAEPMNKAGALRYTTIYLSTGDLVVTKLPYSSTSAAGIVLDCKPNCIVMKGVINE